MGMAAGEVNYDAAAGPDITVVSGPDCMLELPGIRGLRTPAMAAVLAELVSAGAKSIAGTRDLE